MYANGKPFQPNGKKTYEGEKLTREVAKIDNPTTIEKLQMNLNEIKKNSLKGDLVWRKEKLEKAKFHMEWLQKNITIEEMRRNASAFNKSLRANMSNISEANATKIAEVGHCRDSTSYLNFRRRQAFVPFSGLPGGTVASAAGSTH